MGQFSQFIGKNYSEVNDQIKSLANQMGLDPVPWPTGIGMVATDDTTLIVEIKSDMDDVIVNIKLNDGN
jgi:hypothetical protein